MKFSAETWIAWIVASATAAITMATYVHATFKTIKQDEIDKMQSKETTALLLNIIDKRLERIERTLDELKRK